MLNETMVRHFLSSQLIMSETVVIFLQHRVTGTDHSCPMRKSPSRGSRYTESISAPSKWLQLLQLNPHYESKKDLSDGQRQTIHAVWLFGYAKQRLGPPRLSAIVVQRSLVHPTMSYTTRRTRKVYRIWSPSDSVNGIVCFYLASTYCIVLEKSSRLCCPYSNCLKRHSIPYND